MLAEVRDCEALGVRNSSAGPHPLPSEADTPKRLLIVFQSRSGGTQRLVDAAEAGGRLALEGTSGADLQVKHAFDTTPDDVLGASAILIATPANFGYMSGAVKDFFERVYHPCLDQTGGMPYSLIVKGDTDTDGAAASVQRIAIGMGWRQALPPLLVVGELGESDVERAHELGATLAAGMESGIF